MTEQKNKAEEDKGFKPTMTKAQAAKLVKRTVPVLDDKGNQKLNKNDEPMTKQVGISEGDVLNFAEYEDKVVVVTTQGEKLVHTK